MRNETILIPALNPDIKMLSLIKELLNQDFQHIIIIDDGSSSSFLPIFEKAKILGCMIATHTHNLGKGSAIKTGISKSLELFPCETGVITMDCDGQHTAYDAVKISQAMVMSPHSLILGIRDFTGKDVPFKSRNGNRISSAYFKFSTGVTCPDTQTGLRGIPVNLFDLALLEEGTRYEFEMLFLEDSVKIAPLKMVPIKTIYENNNKGSHFRPFKDAIRIFKRPIRFAGASLIGALVDYIFFIIFFGIFKNHGVIATTAAITAATVAARIFSGCTNFFLNKYWSFHSDGKTGNEILKYGILFIIQMFLSAAFVSILTYLHMQAIIAKLIVDTSLFFASFIIQKNIVFNSATKNRREVIQ